MFNPKDYTVGWLCAISMECVAAQAFLDEKHKGPEYLSQNDNNDYTLGRIGKHNVVIAVLPDGEYGTSSAASVARDMLHSFPNVRIGLMVGIGGGAPSRKHDIRLGDIVVSAPRDGKGGVFQYDFGKTIQDQSFRPTGFLNQPPMVLRTAVSGLKTQYESEGHQLEEAINRILEKKPRLKKKYKRPDLSSDRLYQSVVIHPLNDDTNCGVVCGDDPSNLILRPERIAYEDNPAVHYGLIASGNQLMKDALLRDKFAVENDVLCFEMEAAGLINHFPCLVIRGICDYSDSHKNKEWQGYAAMVAAAYTKDLLCRIAPNRIEAEKKIGDILSGVQEGLTVISRDVDKLLCVHHDQEHQAILNWLTATDYSSQQSDFIERRQEGTGEWLLKSNEFQEWINQKQILFCPGIPGAGKTIATSIVIDHLYRKFQEDTSVGIAYLYCNFRRQQEQHLTDLLLSLLKQFAHPSVPKTVISLYEYHKEKGTRPSFAEVLDVLYTVVTGYTRAFIVIDALDECQVSDGTRDKFLSEIFQLQAKTGVNFFATSRFIPDIRAEFERRESILLEIRARDGDVRSYLEGHMSRLPSFVKRQPNLQEEIKTEIACAVDGMFLLAQLYLDSLIGKISPKATKIALQNLRKRSKSSNNNDDSNPLYLAYEEAMKRIKSQHGDFPKLATMVLS
ncbi:nucleoside phosphorylase domain-containing protein, partial [Talaromyces proteolyticus]